MKLVEILTFLHLRAGLPIQGAEEQSAVGSIDALIPTSLGIMSAPCALQVKISINAFSKWLKWKNRILEQDRGVIIPDRHSDSVYSYTLAVVHFAVLGGTS